MIMDHQTIQFEIYYLFNRVSVVRLNFLKMKLQTTLSHRRIFY